MDGPVEIGLYGKLPSHGDFLRRRVSDRFVAVWDGWLQRAIAASRTTLGTRWLEVYLTSPSWRFVCAAGVVGDSPAIGLMVPSVDRVGRYFHLTLVAELPDHVAVVSAASAAGSFFDSAERLVVETLASPTIDFARFDRRVRQLSGELTPVVASPSVRLDESAAAVLAGGSPAWQVPTGAAVGLTPVFEQLLTHRLTALYDPLVLWWSAGSAMVEPSCLVGAGLPDTEAFVALLDGAWSRGRWSTVPAHLALDESGGADTLVEDLSPPRYRSAGATDAGRVRVMNQDAFLERPDAGLWVVADGLGGHSHGELASRMVCDALVDFLPHASFEGMVQQATERLHQVNEHLARAGARAVPAVVSGSTVVTLLVRGTRCAVIWAGDSRAYRLRAGRLEQVTRDHSVADESGGLLTESATAITRAVGAEPTLELDVYRDRVRAGDRFLLCSDGLTRTVPEGRIVEWLQHEYISAAVQGLINASLDAGAPDNVTVIVVEAYAQGWT